MTYFDDFVITTAIEQHSIGDISPEEVMAVWVMESFTKDESC